MNSDQILWTPYEELECFVLENELTLETPWISVKGELQSDEALDFANFWAKNMHREIDNQMRSQFLAPFCTYPLSYWQSNKGSNHKFRPYMLSKLRRHRLLGTRSAISSKKDLSNESLKVAIKQNHFITSKCDSILTEAINKFPEASKELKEYQQEEHGHDELIARALKFMDGTNEEVLEETEQIIRILKNSVQESLLSFCGCLDFFEGIKFSNQDSPLGAAVEKAFGKKAANPLHRHFKINRQHDHDQIGISILMKKPQGSSEEFDQALKTTRRLSQAANRLNQKIFST